MAKRPANRRNVRNAPNRQVVSRPVDTTVFPGAEGMPEQPTPRQLPTPPQETDLNVAEFAARRDANNAIREAGQFASAFSELSEGMSNLAAGSRYLGAVNEAKDNLELDWQIEQRRLDGIELQKLNLSLVELQEQGYIPDNANPNYLRSLSEWDALRTARLTRDELNSRADEIATDPANSTLSGFQDTFNKIFDANMSGPVHGDEAWYDMQMSGLRNQIWESVKANHQKVINGLNESRFNSYVGLEIDELIDQTRSMAAATGMSHDDTITNVLPLVEGVIQNGYAGTRSPAAMRNAIASQLIDKAARSANLSDAAWAKSVLERLEANPKDSPGALLTETPGVVAEKYLANKDRIEANIAKGRSLTALQQTTEVGKHGQNFAESSFIDEMMIDPTQEPMSYFWSVDDLMRNSSFSDNLVNHMNKVYEELGATGSFRIIDSDLETGKITLRSNDPNLLGHRDTVVVDMGEALKKAKTKLRDHTRAMIAGSTLGPAEEAVVNALADEHLQTTDPELRRQGNDVLHMVTSDSSRDKLDSNVMTDNANKFAQMFDYYRKYKGVNSQRAILGLNNPEVERLYDLYSTIRDNLVTGTGSDPQGVEEAYERLVRVVKEVEGNSLIAGTFNTQFSQARSLVDTTDSGFKNLLFVRWVGSNQPTGQSFEKLATDTYKEYDKDYHSVSGTRIHASNLPLVVGDGSGETLSTLQRVLGTETNSGDGLRGFRKGNNKTELGEKIKNMTIDYASRYTEMPDSYQWIRGNRPGVWALHGIDDDGWTTGKVGEFTFMEIMEMSSWVTPLQPRVPIESRFDPERTW